MKLNNNCFKPRSATFDDLEAIASISVLSWHSTYKNIVDGSFLKTITIEQQLPRAKRIVESSLIECILVYNCETLKVIGYACIGNNREKNVDVDSELQAIYLLQEYQGQGAGKILFNESLKTLKNMHHKKMMVSVLKNNIKAINFYEKQGGHLIGEDRVNLGGVFYTTSTYLWNLQQT